MPVAQRVNRIKPSPSTAAAQRVRELKARGHAILDLTVGEPDFDTPDHVKAAAIEAIGRGDTKYTPVNGIPELRAAIADRLADRHGIRYAADQITVGGGAKQVIFLALMATLDRRDRTVKLLNDIPGLFCLAPSGGFYLFVNCIALLGKRTPTGEVIHTDEDFTRYLLESQQVAVIHGSAYGTPGYFRISFATGSDILDESCQRIGRACAELS